MQYIVKNVIHLYTGMREQEVLRMQYDCLSDEIYLKEVVDDNGVTRDLARSVSVLSTTTKFTGYKKSESWFAPSEVVKAVKIAQAICRGLASIYKIDVDNDCPLFLNPAVLRKRNTDVGVGKLGNFYNKIPLIEGVRIELSDIQELAQTDTKRDFYSEPEFAVGRSWPLTGHQFRRSLAFYGSNSGFISLPSLKSQYKQVTLEMARYYSNGFQNLKTIFGYYDPKSNGFVLPNSHVALEFQMGMPMAVANQLLSDVLFTTRQLRDAYAATLDFPGYELGAVRIYVYEQIRRLIRAGWVVKSPKLSKRGQLFHLLEMPAHINLVLVASRFQRPDNSSPFHSESVEGPLVELPTRSAQNESDDQGRLQEMLKETRLDLLSSMGETERYKQLFEEIPVLRARLQGEYHEVRDRSSRLLGHLRALENSLKALAAA